MDLLILLVYWNCFVNFFLAGHTLGSLARLSCNLAEVNHCTLGSDTYFLDVGL